MIDTINIKVNRPLHADVLKAIETAQGASHRGDWSFKMLPNRDHNGRHSIKLEGGHHPTGIQLRGQNGIVEWVQASLPRVLFANNGRLLRTPGQLAEAHESLKAIVNTVTTVREPLFEYCRVDLVLHFRCDIAKFIAAHRHCRHPLIRNETTEYGARGLDLKGSRASIVFYDKLRRMTGQHGNILRVEAQLKKPKLNELFGRKKLPLYALDFWTSYRVYRQIMCQLKPVPMPKAFGLNYLLASCEADGFRFRNGSTAMENYRATVSPETFFARRRQVKGHILHAAGIDWSKLLPENSLPDDLPDVDPDTVSSNN